MNLHLQLIRAQPLIYKLAVLQERSHLLSNPQQLQQLAALEAGVRRVLDSA